MLFHIQANPRAVGLTRRDPAPLHPTLGNVCQRVWLSQLGKEGAPGIAWVGPGMLLQPRQCPGPPSRRTMRPQTSAVPSGRSPVPEASPFSVGQAKTTSGPQRTRVPA